MEGTKMEEVHLSGEGRGREGEGGGGVVWLLQLTDRKQKLPTVSRTRQFSSTRTIQSLYNPDDEKNPPELTGIFFFLSQDETLVIYSPRSIILTPLFPPPLPLSPTPSPPPSMLTKSTKKALMA